MIDISAKSQTQYNALDWKIHLEYLPTERDDPS